MVCRGPAIFDEHTLEFLLAFDGRIHHLEQGYWLKLEFKRIAPAPERPHATLCTDPARSGCRRLMGFDNAHGVSPLGSRRRKWTPQHDHWHRTSFDEGRPYAFTNAAQLLTDFEAEVERVLSELGIDKAVIGDGDLTDRRPT